MEARMNDVQTHGVDLDWTHEQAEQLDWHWRMQLRARLDGLSDAEYLWEPVPGCWSVRRRGESSAPMSIGNGALTLDYAHPAPEPPPVTTTAWRMAHIIVGVLGMRVASHFGGPPLSWDSFEFAGTATRALDQLDQVYEAWMRGARSLVASRLALPVGPA